MITQGHSNNPYLSKDKTILAFDRFSPDVPAVKIIDRECEDFSKWRKQYGTFVQSIRMLSCTGDNVWAQQKENEWSTAAIGTDLQGRVLFIHIGTPFTTHDVVEMLKRLPIDLDRAMYSEGGVQAQLYIKTGDREYELTGIPGYNQENDIPLSMPVPLPNVIGIVKKN